MHNFGSFHSSNSKKIYYNDIIYVVHQKAIQSYLHFDYRDNLSITCFMDMESTLGQMVHFMREISMKTSKN